MTAFKGRTVALSVMVPSWEPTLGASWSWKVPGRRGWVRVQADRLSCPRLAGPHRWRFLQRGRSPQAGRWEARVAVVGAQPPVCGGCLAEETSYEKRHALGLLSLQPALFRPCLFPWKKSPQQKTMGLVFLQVPRASLSSRVQQCPLGAALQRHRVGAPSPMGRLREVSQIF